MLWRNHEIRRGAGVGRPTRDGAGRGASAAAARRRPAVRDPAGGAAAGLRGAAGGPALSRGSRPPGRDGGAGEGGAWGAGGAPAAAAGAEHLRRGRVGLSRWRGGRGGPGGGPLDSRRWRGRRRWARRLGVHDPAEAAAYVVAALREAWEETGILLADGVDAASLAPARRALLAGEVSLRRYSAGGRSPRHPRPALRRTLDHPGIGAAALRHALLPRACARRCAVRAVRTGAGGGAVDRPGRRGRGVRGGRPPPPPPTAHTLRRLASYASLEDAWHDLRDAPVPTILPRMYMGTEGAVIEF